MKRFLVIALALFVVIEIKAVVNLDSIFSYITKCEFRKYGDGFMVDSKCRYGSPKDFAFSQKADTIYLKEYITDEGYCFYKVWNRKNAFESQFSTPEPISRKRLVHPKELELIESWNVEKLKTAGFSRDIPTPEGIVERRGVEYNFLTRIIIKNGYASFETITYYKPWFPPE